MPVWGKILTPEQLDALVQYTLTASKGREALRKAPACLPTIALLAMDNLAKAAPIQRNPSQTIAPISSAEFLKHAGRLYITEHHFTGPA